MMYVFAAGAWHSSVAAATRRQAVPHARLAAIDANSVGIGSLSDAKGSWHYFWAALWLIGGAAASRKM